VDIALKHHLVSRHTSLVAIDVTPARPDGEPLDSQALSVNLPHGWSQDAVFGSLLLATLALLTYALARRKP
jgi:Ca-activated chloride channel family protein